MSDIDRPKRRIKPWKIRASIVLLVVLSIVIPVGMRALQRARCCASMMVSSSLMRQVATEISMQATSGDPSPEWIGLMFAEGFFSGGYYQENCTPDSDRDVVVLGHMFRAIETDPVLLNRLKSEPGPSVEAKQWESVGRFRFSHNHQSYHEWRSNIIVGISCYENSNVLISFADVHVDYVTTPEELREVLESDRAARDEHGLAPLQIDIEQEIADYRTEKELDPFVE